MGGGDACVALCGEMVTSHLIGIGSWMGGGDACVALCGENLPGVRPSLNHCKPARNNPRANASPASVITTTR